MFVPPLGCYASQGSNRAVDEQLPQIPLQQQELRKLVDSSLQTACPLPLARV